MAMTATQAFPSLKDRVFTKRSSLQSKKSPPLHSYSYHSIKLMLSSSIKGLGCTTTCWKIPIVLRQFLCISMDLIVMEEHQLTTQE